MKATILTPRTWAGLLLCTAITASAVPVTFQVDMGYQISQFNFFPDTGRVTARGSFDGWGGGIVLTNSPANTNLYQGTTNISGAAGSTVDYKFVYNNNPGGADQWESIGNRQFTLASSAQTLQVAYFNDQWDGPAIPVTFRVDMSVQIAAGKLDPATDAVEARGSFNNWAGGFALTNSPANTNIYLGTFDVPSPPGASSQFKFVVNAPAPKGVVWESINNRSFILNSSAQTLPVFYFNDASGFPIKAAVLFQVNMNAQVITGNFDKTNDQVWARGNVLGWGTPDQAQGFQLLEDAARPGVYTNLFTMGSQVTGDVFGYKYTIWRPGTSATVWEGGDNKTLSFTGTEPTNAAGYHVKIVGPTYFDGVSPSDMLAADTLVTFRVNMSNARGYTGSPIFNPAVNGVWINGVFLSWWGWGSAPAEDQMWDDGTNGDAVAGDKIYSWQRLFTKGSFARVEYKYGIDSADNEAASGNNHVRFIRAVGTFVMPVDTFGVIYQEPEVGSLAISSVAAGHVTLTWNGRPGVHLQSSTNLTSSTWVDVPGTDGLSTVALTVGSGNAFFRLVKP